MFHSPELGKLATALAKAQGAIGDALKDKTNPHFKSSYADLASVRAAIQKPLSENGLAYIQLLSTSEDGLDVKTMLIHESGEFVGDTLTVPLGQRTAQAVGSAASYGRRYGLMAIVGIAADDDDGNAAQDAAPNGARKSTRGPDWGKANQAKKRGDWPAFMAALKDCQSAHEVDRLEREYEDTVYASWSQQWRDNAKEEIAKYRADFKEPGEALNLREQLEGSLEAEQSAPMPTRAEYIAYCVETAEGFTDRKVAIDWWAGQAAARRRYRLNADEESSIKALIKARLDKPQTTVVPNGREKPYVDKAGNELHPLDAG